MAWEAARESSLGNGLVYTGGCPGIPEEIPGKDLMSTLSAGAPLPPTETTPPKWFYKILFACFYVSGTAGLIYQVAWMKALGLVFGRTTYAITAVLGAFMAGLALGSWLLGRYGEKTPNPLRLYGLIELGIALTGLSSLGGLWLTQRLYVEVYQQLADQPALLLSYRFLASSLVLVIPTTLMGGTYPIVVRYLTRSSEQLGVFASRLYWLNTAGAITGTCLAGFVLLWQLGLTLTLVTAAVLNLAVAGTVLLSSARLKTLHPDPAPDRSEAKELAGTTRGTPGPKLILLVSGISGLTAMIYEIGWTRILAVFLSSTTHAFTLMLATFLFGITLGSYLFERWHRQWALSQKLLGQLLILLALGGVLFLAFGAKLADLTLWLAQAGGESGTALIGTPFVVCFLAMILPTTLFGLIFPLTLVLYCGSGSQRAASTGRLYAVNTLGAIVGAFVTGLLLIEWLNTVNTLLLASGLNAVVAAFVFAGGDSPRSWWRTGMSVCVVGLLIAVAVTRVFASPVFYGRTLMANATRPDFRSALTLDEIIHKERPIYIREGMNTTVTVSGDQEDVYLHIGGRTEGSSGDERTQLPLAYLPVGFHPNPKRVLVIGWGSGATVYAAAQFSTVERVDCVEIEPAVVAAAPYLRRLNRGADLNPKVRVIVDDARNYLMVTRERYDVIISEPSYLWSAGVSSLFTEEFYRQVREHLGPDGLFMQWVQAYQLAPRDFNTVLRTLHSSFEHMSLWRGTEADFLILASPTPRRFSLKPLEAEYGRNASLRENLSEYLSIHEPAGLLGYYLLDDSELRELSAWGDRNTDDRNVLEYRAGSSLPKQTVQLNQMLVRNLRKNLLPPFLDLEDGAAAVLAGAETQVEIGMLNHALGASFVPELLKSNLASPRSLLVRAAVAQHEGRIPAAVADLEQALRLDPGNMKIVNRLGRLHILRGEPEQARRVLEASRATSPQNQEALRLLVNLEARSGNLEKAIALQQQLLATQTDRPFADWALLGTFHLSAGQVQQAVAAFGRSIEIEPLSYVARRNIATLLARSGEVDKAIAEYRFLIQYYPNTDPALYLELSALLQKRGQEYAVRETLRKAKRMFPTSPEVERAVWMASAY
ncbi:MAG: hypothetical protein A3H28_08120 [Acidobacteria bacterium RIFCSPLOWO2_02_FULL_61_28]|nr:MAG: hypothetical protein A3H28_08120 [Acidobacteria bacterium RIFCSPLOWO2_02_FULL_61_28]